jgi:hypothetical protein
MDDAAFVNLQGPCILLTFNDQKGALALCRGPQQIFRDCNTYVLMVIPFLQRHWVPVLVTISPVTFEQFPEHAEINVPPQAVWCESQSCNVSGIVIQQAFVLLKSPFIAFE